MFLNQASTGRSVSTAPTVPAFILAKHSGTAASMTEAGRAAERVTKAIAVG